MTPAIAERLGLSLRLYPAVARAVLKWTTPKCGVRSDNHIGKPVI
jgi:hypothetical protein